MGMTSEAILCYGVQITKGAELPWGDGCIDEWWAFTVNADKFKPKVARPYDKHGSYLPEFAPKNRMSLSKHPQVTAYHKERSGHMEAFGQPPVKVVHCGSNDYPILVVAIRDVGHSSGIFEPETIDLNSLSVSDEQIEVFNKFCEEHDIFKSAETLLGWLLCSCYG